MEDISNQNHTTEDAAKYTSNRSHTVEDTVEDISRRKQTIQRLIEEKGIGALNPYKHLALSFDDAFQLLYPTTYDNCQKLAPDPIKKTTAYDEAANERWRQAIKLAYTNPQISSLANYPPRIRADMVDYVTDQCRSGAHAFFLSLTYKTSSKTSLRRETVERYFQKLYTALLRMTVHPHKYHRHVFRPILPTVLATLDKPGSKIKNLPASKPKQFRDPKADRLPPLESNTVDLHHHALVLVPDQIADKFYWLCAQEYSSLIPTAPRLSDLFTICPFLLTLNIQPIFPSEDSRRKVVSYAIGNNVKSTTWSDDLIVFPKAQSEKSHKNRRLCLLGLGYPQNGAPQSVPRTVSPSDLRSCAVGNDKYGHTLGDLPHEEIILRPNPVIPMQSPTV